MTDADEERAREIVAEWSHSNAAERLYPDLASAIATALRSTRTAALEEAAKLVETYPNQILQMWDRPGGPPGNGYRATTHADIAAAIRSMRKGE